jgi:SAM-dependent methyltransferase
LTASHDTDDPGLSSGGVWVDRDTHGHGGPAASTGGSGGSDGVVSPTDPDHFRLDPDDPAHAGQAVYTPTTLRAYDTLVVRLSNSFAWRCPAKAIVAQYDRHLTSTHLDVGPGTGYYLDHCRVPRGARLALLDANPGVLRHAARRLRRHRPALHAADVLKPVPMPPGQFGSIGLSYVLHCLPGGLPGKAVVFDHLIPLLAPGGTLFGSTILDRGVRHTGLARRLIPLYNRKGIFANAGDALDLLESELARRFGSYDLEVKGSVALFAARLPVPRRAA